MRLKTRLYGISLVEVVGIKTQVKSVRLGRQTEGNLLKMLFDP